MLANVMTKFQHHGHHILRHCIGPVTGDVRNRNVAASGRSYIHHVVASGKHRDEFEARRAFNHRGGDGCFIRDQDVRAVAPLFHFVRCGAFEHDQVAAPSQCGPWVVTRV